MKKKNIVALLLALVMCFSLCACGSQATFGIGEETTTDNFTFTVNEIGCSKDICVDENDSFGLYSVSGNSLQANDGYVWLYYSVSYNYIGEEMLSSQGQFFPTVEYGDDKFNTPSLIGLRYDGDWSLISCNEIPMGVPLPATYYNHEYNPNVEKDYDIHGAVQIPEKAIEDTETPKTLYLNFGKDKLECVIDNLVLK